MKYPFALVASLASFAAAASAGELPAREGWRVIDTKMPFAALSDRLEAAIKDNKMGLVTSASASEGAKAQGFTIAGNRIVGVYRNDFARRMLQSSVAAGIEAPIRFYLVENDDGTSTLAYKTPTAVFAAYSAGAKPDLKSVAGKSEVVGFSTRWAKSKARVRLASEAPASPDTYESNVGIVKLGKYGDYPTLVTALKTAIGKK